MRDTNPLQSMYSQVQRLLKLVVFKDKQAADLFETNESKWAGQAYVRACLEDDNYATYSEYWTFSMFTDINPGIKYSEYQKYVNDPKDLGLRYRDYVRTKGRELFLQSYEEPNSYYRSLIGLPNLDDTEYIYPSEETQSVYSLPNKPIHELSTSQQDIYISTDEYVTILKDNPTKRYLRYLGSNKVDLLTARRALDFDIIRYPTNDSYLNPKLLSSFATIYPDCREFIMSALYNPKLADIYLNYREFMGMLIIAMTLLQLNSSALEGMNSHDYIDDSILHTLFDMYGVPEDDLMTNEIRRDLAHNILKLVKERGTDQVYYDLIRILGYEDVRVSKLMLMKGQLGLDPYFLQIDLQDQNPYETVVNGKAFTFSYEDITEGDPQWWDTKEVRDKLYSNPYSISDSKYITLNANISQSQYIFETIYFIRMILDNKSHTTNFQFEIPDLFGSKKVSVYDCTLFLLCAICMLFDLSGDLSDESEELLATAGFNFDYDRDIVDQFISTSKHIDKKKLSQFLSNLRMDSITDVNRVFSDVLLPLNNWLQSQITKSENKEEFVEYEALYKALFTYDVTRNPLIDDYRTPIEIVRDKYSLSDEEMDLFQVFYPHDGTHTIEKDELSSHINNTRYHYPFLDEENQVPWYIDLGDHGILYFYDILNSDDCRLLSNNDGRIFQNCDYGDWELDESVMDLALRELDSLDEDVLELAYIQVESPSKSNPWKSYQRSTPLPFKIRSGIYKDILRDKLALDLNGFATKPTSYFECLYRQNPELYSVLLTDDRFNHDKDAWVRDITTIITTMERELGVHLKNLEHYAVGADLYFKPLVSMIGRFKSMMVSIAKVGVKFVFDNKFDIGGNSNMMKLFDAVNLAIMTTTITGTDDSRFTLYDVNHSQKTYVQINDKSTLYRSIVGKGFLSQQQTKRMGSIHLSDECQLFHNNVTDGWFPGDPDNGRFFSVEDPIRQYDLEGWMEFTESTTPIE